MQFLMTMRLEFEPIRAFLLHRNVKTIDIAVGDLIREETWLRSQARLDTQQLPSSDSAFAVSHPG
ncbi:hypothetical protein LINGRAHAP2_LOCUS23139 [Linum grandiflorum]